MLSFLTRLCLGSLWPSAPRRDREARQLWAGGARVGSRRNPSPKAEQELSGLRDKGGPCLVNTSPTAHKHQGCCPHNPTPAAPPPQHPNPSPGPGGHSHLTGRRRLHYPHSPPRRQQDAEGGSRPGGTPVPAAAHLPCPRPGTSGAELGPRPSVRGAELGSGEPPSVVSCATGPGEGPPLQVVCVRDALKTQPALAILHSQDKGTGPRGPRLLAGWLVAWP